MNDIVHRLRAAIVLLDAEREEAADEIERLRVTQCTMAYQDEEPCRAIAQRDAEIERLRGALEAISIVEVSDHTSGSMRRIALQALRARRGKGRQ